MDYRTFISFARSFARQYISPMEDGYCLYANMQYCDWHLLGDVDDAKRKSLISRTENEIKKAHKKQKGKNKQLAILDLALLFVDLHFLATGDIKYKKRAFVEKLSAIDDKLTTQFDEYLKQLIKDNPYHTLRYRELSDQELAILNSEELPEISIVYKIAENGKFDLLEFEQLSYREFVLHALEFMKHYVISLSKSCNELYHYLDIAKAYLDKEISRDELYVHYTEINQKIDNIQKTSPLHIIYIHIAVSYFVWFAFLDNDEEEGQQDPSYSYFLDDLQKVQYGLVVQLFMPLFERFGLVE